MLPKLKQFSVCKGQCDSTMPQREPRPFPSSNVISCMFPYKQSWQSGWPRCHSLFSPRSNSDAQRRSLPHFPPVCSRLFFFSIFFFCSWKPYGFSPSEETGLIIITSRSCSQDDSPQCASEVGAWESKTNATRWCGGIRGMCNKVTTCTAKPHKCLPLLML